MCSVLLQGSSVSGFHPRYTLHGIDGYISLHSSWLQKFLRHSWLLMTSSDLRIVGQVLCIKCLLWDLFKVFLIVRLG